MIKRDGERDTYTRKIELDVKRVREEDLLNETLHVQQSWCWHFSLPISIAICFDVNFFFHPPIPFTKSSNFSFAQALWYMEKMNAWMKRRDWNESNWSKHAHSCTCTHTSTDRMHNKPTNNKHHQQKATLTHLLPQQSNCVDLFAIHKEFIQYQVCVCVCECVEMFRFHFMQLNAASNVVKWIFFTRCQFAASMCTLHIFT